MRRPGGKDVRIGGEELTVQRCHVRPARPGLLVADPDHGGSLAAEGADVTWSTYWHRRVADGDVVVTAIIEGAAPAASSPASAAASELPEE